ncbi:MAG: hypothetical protein QM523_09495 [Candidatus Pacebacteria bacterium]|nr:hypothetical protein [Candidatus Paceibacterota bacterium]
MAVPSIEILNGIWRLDFTYQVAAARPPLELLVMIQNGVMAGLANAGVIATGDFSFRPNGAVEFQIFFDMTFADSSIQLISRGGKAVREQVQFAGVLSFDSKMRMMEGFFDHGVVPIMTRGVFVAPIPL